MNEEFAQSIVIMSVDQNFIQKLSGLLEESHYRSILAHDTATLVEVFSDGTPGLIILDIGKESEKNLNLIRMIREHSEKHVAEIPIIIVSESGNPIEISSALKCGVQAYFVKSNFNATHILSYVSKYIGSATQIEAETASPTVAEVVPSPTPSVKSQTKLLIIEDDKFLRDL